MILFLVFLCSAISVPILKFLLYLISSYRSFPNFWKKKLLSLVLKQGNNAQVLTCKFLQNIGNFHSWPWFQSSSPPPDLEPRTVQSVPTALSRPPHTYLITKDNALFALFGGTSCKRRTTFYHSFNIVKINLYNAVIFSNYQLFEEVKNCEEIKSNITVFCFSLKKYLFLFGAPRSSRDPSLIGPGFFPSQEKLNYLVLCSNCVNFLS